MTLPTPSEKVLVTGASGFIGGHLAAALVAHGHRVLGVDVLDPARPVMHVDYVRCDIREATVIARCMREFTPDAVLHLAARTDLDETQDLNGYAANIVGVENVVAAIRSSSSVRRAICTSSQLVCRIGYTPRHDQDYAPTTLYGESKVRTEQIWRRGDGGGTTWCIVRPTTIWGPWMNPHYLRFFRMVRDGTYRHVGHQPIWKSYGYVANTVAQYGALLDAPASSIAGRVFYLADDPPINLQEWADVFQKALGAPDIRRIPVGVARGIAKIGDVVNRLGLTRFPFNSFRLTNVLTESRVDLSSTRAVCGESPYTVEQGVEETARWLRAIWSTT